MAPRMTHWRLLVILVGAALLVFVAARVLSVW
jgi:hypothetical protein